MAGSDVRQGGWWFLIAALAIGVLLLALVVLLPLSMASVLGDLINPTENAIYNVSVPAEGEGQGSQSLLHITAITLEPLQQRVTFRVAGHQLCRPDCDSNAEIVLFSLRLYETRSAGMPPSARITLPGNSTVITQTVELPAHGYPVLYPFDTYEMMLGVSVLHTQPDGSSVALPGVEAADRLFLTLQEQLAREEMHAPTHLDPDQFNSEDNLFDYALVERLQFGRPLYVRVLSVLLVLLIAAAAAYAVFMRPLHELVINAGGLVLGVWGIRSILPPGTLSYLTAVDLALAVVILFLLGAITVRALQFCYSRSVLAAALRHGASRPPPPPLEE